MKRLLSIALSLCVLLASLSGLLITPASAIKVPVDMIQNGDFENLTANTAISEVTSSKVTSTHEWVGDKSSNYDHTVLQETDGNQYLQFTKQIYYGLGDVLEAGVTYTLSFDLKAPSSTLATNGKEFRMRIVNGTALTSSTSGTGFISPLKDTGSESYIGSSNIKKLTTNSWTHFSYQITVTQTAIDNGLNVLRLLHNSTTEPIDIDNVSFYREEDAFPNLYLQDFETEGTYAAGTNASVVNDSTDTAHNSVFQLETTGTTGAWTTGSALLNTTSIAEMGLAQGDSFYMTFDYRNTKGNISSTNFAITLKQNATAEYQSGYNLTSVADSGLPLTGETVDTIDAATWRTATIKFTIQETSGSTTFDPETHKYMRFVFNRQVENAIIQLDNIRIWTDTNIAVEGMAESVIEPEEDPNAATYGGTAGAKYDLKKARVFDTFKFKVAAHATVQYNGETIEPTDDGGTTKDPTDDIYTIKVAPGAKITLVPDEKVDDGSINRNADDGREVVKVLALGNSFTIDVTSTIMNMQEADKEATKVNLRLARATIGGCTIERHYNNITNGTADYNLYVYGQDKAAATSYNNVTLEQALNATDWDYIVLQQASEVSDTENYETAWKEPATELVEYIKDTVSGNGYAVPEIVIHETWSYSDFGSHRHNEEYADSGDMFQALQANYQKLSNDLGNTRIIPVGTAFQLVREELGDILHRDNNPGHANYLGRLIGAYAFYNTFTGISPTETKFDPFTTSYVTNSSYAEYLKYIGDDGKTAVDLNFAKAAGDETTDKCLATVKQAVKDATALYNADGFGALGSDDAPTAQMRKATEGKELALRFKFTIDTDVLAKGSDIAGYELVEYGSLVTLDKYMTNGWKPVWFAEDDDSINSAGVSEQNGGAAKVTIGRAYIQGEKDTIFSRTGNKTVFTAALTKIGYSSGSDTINYSKWGNGYYVLPYAVYENEAGVRVVKYARDSAFSYSMFEMVKTIEDSTSTDEQVASDKEYVNKLLGISDFETAYNDWKNK